MRVNIANLGIIQPMSTRTSTMHGSPSQDQVDIIEKLVQSAKKGDALSFGQLYDLFYTKIFRYVAYKVGNREDAEDITAEVFIRMLKSINSFSFQGHPFSSWLFRIAKNMVVDYFFRSRCFEKERRKNSRRRTAPLETAGSIQETESLEIDYQLDLDIEMSNISESIKTLTDLQQEVISLRFAGGLSIKETASAVGRKENAVKALQHSAIKKLRLLVDMKNGNNLDNKTKL